MKKPIGILSIVNIVFSVFMILIFLLTLSQVRDVLHQSFVNGTLKDFEGKLVITEEEFNNLVKLYKTVYVVLIVVLIISSVLAFAGRYAVLQEKRSLVLVFGILLLFFGVLSIIQGILTIVYYTQMNSEQNTNNDINNNTIDNDNTIEFRG